jgi:hypothetical protein
MSWDKKIEAHRFLWIFVRGVHFDFAVKDDGTMTTFEEGGKWHNDFIIGSVGASEQIRAHKALIFSLKFNAWLFGNFDVEFEDTVAADKAIDQLAEAFSVPKSLLESVGDAVNAVYKFPSEGV